MKKNKNKDQQDKRYNILLDLRNQSSREFDKLIVYLAAGGLTLTVAFTNNLVDLSTAQNKWLLLVGWIAFIITLVLILISQRTSTKSMDLEMEGKEDDSNRYNCITDLLNVLSTISLILGIICFLIFISINLIYG